MDFDNIDFDRPPAAPLPIFESWLAQAEETEPNDPNAVAVATVDADGMPNVRMVLLKGLSEAGFVFYTNFDSVKGRELMTNAKAAMCFHWKSLHRQVRVRGPVAPVDADEADAYFASRARESRIGAWASQQSRPVDNRAALEKAVEAMTQEFDGQDVPRPPNWSGWRLTPLSIEFWQDGDFRLHDRLVYDRESGSAPWRTQRVYP
ncbi:MAG: pyridoxamine 5'-phosphate oxidase [Parvibaculales bacterium]